MVDININDYLPKKKISDTITDIKESMKHTVDNIKQSAIRSIDAISTVSYINEAKNTLKEKLNTSKLPNIDKSINLPIVIDNAKKKAIENLSPAIHSINTQVEKLEPLRQKIMEFPKDINIRLQRLNDYNIFDKVKQLQHDIENIKIWRVDKVDPSLIEMYNNITSILDRIQNDIYPSILNAATIAESSKNAAISAMNFSKSFVLKLQLSGEVLSLGIQDIVTSSVGLQNTFKNEAINMYNYWNNFGYQIEEKAIVVKDNIIDLGNKFVAAANSIGSKLGDLADHINGAYDDVSNAYDEIKDGHALDAASDLRHAINDALRAAEDLKSLAERIQGGFTNVGTSAFNTANSFNNLGQQIYTGSNKLAGDINNSLGKFRNEMNQYVGVYKRVFDDMKTVFTTEYTNEELAKEMEIKEKERNIYIEFTNELNIYETLSVDCRSATYELPIRQREYDRALLNYNNKIAWIENEIQAILDRISKYYPLDKVLAFRPEVNCSDTWSRRVGWARPSCKYNSPSDLGSQVGGTVTNPSTGNQIYTTDKNTFQTYMFVNCQVSYYRYLTCKRGEILKPYTDILNPAKEELDKVSALKQSTCSNISILSTNFRNKWGITPEEGTNLTYEQIINLNK